MQVKLLRVLQERKLRPSARREPNRRHARHRSNESRSRSMVKDGTFREDLYYRISVSRLSCPRCAKVGRPFLSGSAFHRKFCAGSGRELSISENAVRLLESYIWPGKVRELETQSSERWRFETTDRFNQNACRKKFRTTTLTRIAESFEIPEEGVNLTAHLDQLEKTYVLEALRRKVGNTKLTPPNCLAPRFGPWALLDKHASGTNSPDAGRTSEL